jgi:hypothetical protein
MGSRYPRLPIPTVKDARVAGSSAAAVVSEGPGYGRVNAGPAFTVGAAGFTGWTSLTV